MSKIKLLSIGIIGLLLINAALIVFLYLHRPSAGGAPPDRMPFSGKSGPQNIIISRLRFNERQVNRYQELIKQHRAGLQQLEGEILKARNELYQTLADSTRHNSSETVAKLADLQKRIETLHYQHFIAIKNLCTKSQLPLFNNLTNDLASYFRPSQKMPANPPHGMQP